MLLLFGCQKSDRTLSPSAAINSVLNLNVEEAKSWFKVYEEKVSVMKKAPPAGLLSNPRPEWSSSIFTTDQKSFVIEVPIRFDKQIGYNFPSSESIRTKPSNAKTTLVILKDKETGYVRFVLMHLTAKVGVNLQKVNYGNRSDFSGTVIFTTMEGSFLNGWIYDKGKIISVISKKYENTSSRMELPEDCTIIQIDWYEQTCTTYPNNTEVCSGWIYTHTSYQTVCTSDGSGDGGGPGGGNTECSYTNATARSMLNAISFSLTSNGSVVSGTIVGPDVNGQIEKELLINRHGVTWNFFAGYKVDYMLLFRGRVTKAAINKPWKWKTFSFDKIQKESGSVPICFSEKTAATVVTSISTDSTAANFSSVISATVTVVCLFGAEASTKTITMNDTYIADEEAR